MLPVKTQLKRPVSVMVSAVTLLVVVLAAAVAIVATAAQTSIPRSFLAASADDVDVDTTGQAPTEPTTPSNPPPGPTDPTTDSDDDDDRPRRGGTGPTVGACVYVQMMGKHATLSMPEEYCTDAELRKNPEAGCSLFGCRWLAYCLPGTAAVTYERRDEEVGCLKKDGPKQSSYLLQAISGRDQLITTFNNGSEPTAEDNMKFYALKAGAEMGYTCEIAATGRKPANNDNLAKKPLVDFMHGQVVWEVASKYNTMVSRLRKVTSDPATNCREFPPGCGVYDEPGTITRGLAKTANTVDVRSMPGNPHEYGLALDINCKEPKLAKNQGCSANTNEVLSRVKGKGFTIIQECTTNTNGVCSGGTNQIIHIDLMNRTTNPYTFGGTNKIYYNCEFNAPQDQ